MELWKLAEWETIEDRYAEVNKCLVIEQHHPQNLINLEKKFKQEIGDRSDIIFTSTKLLEVLPKGITKVTGIQRLIDSLGIKMSEVMAFGDYDNDIEMLNAAGLGVVVENGSAAAKASADLIIGAMRSERSRKISRKPDELVINYSAAGCSSLMVNRMITARIVKGRQPINPAGVGPSSMEKGSLTNNSPIAAMPFKAPWANTAGQTLFALRESHPKNIPP